MDIDKTTFNDLSIFHQEEESSIFHKLDFTRTRGGRDWLVKFFSEPFNDLKRIADTHQILKSILEKQDEWPSNISNGTIMVMEKFYESAIDSIPDSPNLLNAYIYRLLHAPDFSLVRYSVGHFADFIRGCRALVKLFDNDQTPHALRMYLQRAKELMKDTVIVKLGGTKQGARFSATQTIYYGHYINYRYKHIAFELIGIFSRLDAWYSMAAAMKRFSLSFPQFSTGQKPQIEVNSLYHLLLSAPVSYDVELDPEQNFLFLTGANMAGKSTFIKAIGAAVYLAHIGMGVPAQHMKLTLFNGILSNINVVDNIVKGESYFFNEVQRIKSTILKINNDRKWLVLIDELFKGTNVQDAMKCSLTVIKGLIKIKSSLFILSTHLYEIGDELKTFPNISFRYFETSVKDDQLDFSYQLKEGISNDRLGYLILKKEKVVELLENL
ncbi:MAG: DNA mismatch repair protein MutS [Chitinophagaceae bacterium]